MHKLNNSGIVIENVHVTAVGCFKHGRCGKTNKYTQRIHGIAFWQSVLHVQKARRFVSISAFCVCEKLLRSGKRASQQPFHALGSKDQVCLSICQSNRTFVCLLICLSVFVLAIGVWQDSSVWTTALNSVALRN